MDPILKMIFDFVLIFLASVLLSYILIICCTCWDIYYGNIGIDGRPKVIYLPYPKEGDGALQSVSSHNQTPKKNK